MKEIWKNITGYEGLYQVSNLGNVKSLNYNHTGKEKVLRPCNRGGGYYFVTLSKNNKRKHFLVHRLVAQAFILNPLNLPQVNHKDENPSNNCVENLEWCDDKYNNNYGTKNERGIATKNKNKTYGAEKSVYYINEKGKKIFFKSQHEAARVLGCSHFAVWRSINKGYKCKGYHLLLAMI